MNLAGLLQLVRSQDEYRQHLQSLASDHTSTTFNVIRSARPYLTAALAQDWSGPIIYVTGRIKRAYDVTEQLPAWLGIDAPVYRFAEPIPRFYEHAPWGEAALTNRLDALSALIKADDQTGNYPIVVTSSRALIQRTIPVNQFRRAMMTLKKNERHSIDKLLAHWVAIGYQPATVVIEQGTFSRRGGVLDIFPIGMNAPVRIEFFDDEIESFRLFNPSTQRSEHHIEQVVIPPAREALPQDGAQTARHLQIWFDSLPDESEIKRDLEGLANGSSFAYLEFYLPYLYARPYCLLDYASDNTLIVVEDFDELKDNINELIDTAESTRDTNVSMQRLPEDYPVPYVDWQTVEESLQERTILTLSGEGTPSRLFTYENRFGGQLRPAVNYIQEKHGKSEAVIIVSQQTARLKDLYQEQDASGFVPTVQNIEDPPAHNTLAFIHGGLKEGWVIHSRPPVHVITDSELFGWSRPEPRRRKVQRAVRLPEAEYADWVSGDYVVHVDYGIGRFVGMQHRTIEGVEREYLVVEYGGSDTLFVPIHQADRLTRYIGADDRAPMLTRLGKPDWDKIRSKARKVIEEEAHELLELYAQRANASGHAYSPDDHWQHELEASFPYVETEDQLRAVREVKADMEKSIPMDRLICGDVGYGKTEVAIRAAFKAVNDGKQVAVLVPTTILAQQHYETFSNRLAAFPVKIELMSRFRDKDDQERALPQIAAGEVDILIGTHRILSSDITLSDLGLVIIDEEQRFGVKQKDHFKKLRSQVDVLTLTATPIPRTLYMSLAGIRDISMIQTPPEERLPVVTHVGAFDEHLVRQAVLRELERGGQVFVVHNRIRTIDNLREKLEDIVPEARVITAHGQMNAHQLEKVMVAFARGEFDVLLSTSIIENGIDIPNANTLIVDRADWFGLSQLYQLRGRVGRSAQQAYAYFFHHPSGRITDDARARLDTLKENTELGAGFQIAMRDLEIRGAGDVLSTRQTGHISAIGLNLYTQMLSDTVKKLKGEFRNETRSTASSTGIVLNLPIPAYIPNNWMPELSLRLQIYRRIGSISTREGVKQMRAELIDRFGELPQAVDGLLLQIEVKLLAMRVNATGVIVNNDVVQIKLPYLAEIDRDALQNALQDSVSEGIRVTRTAVELPYEPRTGWLEEVIETLERLEYNMPEEVMEGL